MNRFTSQWATVPETTRGEQHPSASTHRRDVLGPFVISGNRLYHPNGLGQPAEEFLMPPMCLINTVWVDGVEYPETLLSAEMDDGSIQSGYMPFSIRRPGHLVTSVPGDTITIGVTRWFPPAVGPTPEGSSSPDDTWLLWFITGGLGRVGPSGSIASVQLSQNEIIVAVAYDWLGHSEIALEGEDVFIRHYGTIAQTWAPRAEIDPAPSETVRVSVWLVTNVDNENPGRITRAGNTTTVTGHAWFMLRARANFDLQVAELVVDMTLASESLLINSSVPIDATSFSDVDLGGIVPAEWAALDINVLAALQAPKAVTVAEAGHMIMTLGENVYNITDPLHIADASIIQTQQGELSPEDVLLSHEAVLFGPFYSFNSHWTPYFGGVAFRLRPIPGVEHGIDAILV